MPIDPKVLDALLGIVQGKDGTPMLASDSDTQLTDALMRARALQSGGVPKHTSPIGGLLGSLGSMADTYRGAQNEQSAQGGLNDLYGQKGSAMQQAVYGAPGMQQLSDDDLNQLVSQYMGMQGE